jgi:hypothetical protein
MTGTSYNPATAAEAEQHAREALTGSGAKIRRRSGAGEWLAPAALAAAWVANLRRVLASGRRAIDPPRR